MYAIAAPRLHDIAGREKFRCQLVCDRVNRCVAVLGTENLRGPPGPSPSRSRGNRDSKARRRHDLRHTRSQESSPRPEYATQETLAFRESAHRSVALQYAQAFWI